MQNQDHAEHPLKVLGLSQTLVAQLSELPLAKFRKALELHSRTLQQLFHPDASSVDEAVVTRFNAAYDVLKRASDDDLLELAQDYVSPEESSAWQSGIRASEAATTQISLERSLAEATKAVEDEKAQRVTEYTEYQRQLAGVGHLLRREMLRHHPDPMGGTPVDDLTGQIFVCDTRYTLFRGRGELGLCKQISANLVLVTHSGDAFTRETTLSHRESTPNYKPPTKERAFSELCQMARELSATPGKWQRRGVLLGAAESEKGKVTTRFRRSSIQESRSFASYSLPHISPYVDVEGKGKQNLVCFRTIEPYLRSTAHLSSVVDSVIDVIEIGSGIDALVAARPTL